MVHILFLCKKEWFIIRDLYGICRGKYIAFCDGDDCLIDNNKLEIQIDYLENHPESDIDYVHGQDSVEKLAHVKNNCGILLGAIDKNTLFPAIAAGGVLPRKTFSMGEAYEKRYYIECRQIMK